MPMNPAQMAGGGQPQPTPPQGQITPEQSNIGGDINKVLEVLGQAIQQSVDQQGYVDMNTLVSIWPQIAQQGGVNIPFQTVMQLIQQNPNLISDLIVRYGLAGITMDGRRIPAEQLAGMGTGATGGMR